MPPAVVELVTAEAISSRTVAPKPVLKFLSSAEGRAENRAAVNAISLLSALEARRIPVLAKLRLSRATT